MKDVRVESRVIAPTDQSRIGRIVMRSVMAMVLFMGGGAAISGIRLLAAGAPNKAGAITGVVMGVGLCALAFWYFYVSLVRAPVIAARLQRTRGLYPGQPWMEREDWQSRRLVHSSAQPALLLWFWTLAWCGLLGLVATINRDKIRAALAESWWNGALGSLFVLAGLAGLAMAVTFTWSWFRYGRSILMLDTLPAYVGDRFIATLEARLHPLPQKPLQIELVCEELHWIETRSQGRRTSRLDACRLGRSTATADPRRFTPGRTGMRGRIEIRVPSDLPSAHIDERGNGIRWQLHVSTAAGDAPFSCSFDVPVFEKTQA